MKVVSSFPLKIRVRENIRIRYFASCKPIFSELQNDFQLVEWKIHGTLVNEKLERDHEPLPTTVPFRIDKQPCGHKLNKTKISLFQ